MMTFSRKYIIAALTAIFAFASCDKHMFDYEDNCDVTHIIRFHYDKNLKWADAFPSEVKSVNLYVYNDAGVFVKQYLGRGEELSSKDYYIQLDLPADKYKFVAWCGLDNGVGAEKESFTVPQPVAGVSRIEELTCALNTLSSTPPAATRAGAAGYSNAELYFLYYDYMEQTLEDNHDGQRYEYDMYLTKDTNHVRIILQDTTGEDMNKDDFELTIEDANAFLEYDNSLRDTGTVTYMPWAKTSDKVVVGKIDTVNGTAEMKEVEGVVADFSVNRMLYSHNRDMKLYIRNSHTKELVAEIPIIDYTVLGLDYYRNAYKHTLDEQELLDREDEHVLTFFFVDGKWIEQEVMIHSWRTTKNDYDAKPTR